ncbi:MAG TPA: C25 family cysteine peptidase [bacterium]|nr:C25 family cysteine peptidase [bacterium]
MRLVHVVCGVLIIAMCGVALADHATEGSEKDLFSRWDAVDLQYSVSFSDYHASRVRYDTEIGSVLSFPCPLEQSREGRVAIVVNSNLYPQIEDQLVVWALDINADGFDVQLVDATFETVQDLRAALASAWQSDDGLVGCILVGDFPVPWYAILDDGEVVDDFPCDLYFEDLDGEFIDSDRDGMFDEHVNGTGDTEPDIWLGRLLASPMSGDEAELVRRYLERNHSYRVGEIEAHHRALLFIDKDWTDLAGYWEDAVSWLYDDVTVITDDDKTNAEEYSRRLRDGYEWVDVMVHSGPDAHYFSYEDVYSMLYSSDLQAATINSLFFVPFACSNSRYVEPDYMGGWYVFGEHSLGLCVIGSTKTGSLYYGQEMYKKLSEGECVGEGFRSWFAGVAPYSADNVSWFYGLTVLGDPTLRPRDTAPPPAPTWFRSKESDDATGVVLSWEAPDSEDLAGFKLYYDTEEVYPPFDGQGLPQGDSPIDVGFATSFSIKYADMGQFDTMAWAVTSYDLRGNESDYSEGLDTAGDPALNPPHVSWVFWDPDSQVSYENGGYVMLRAYVEDDEDSAGSLDVELLVDGQLTGIALRDDGTNGDSGAGDSFYSRAFEIPKAALPSGRYLISIVATDSDGNRSNEWPYLTVSEPGGTGEARAGRRPPIAKLPNNCAEAVSGGGDVRPIIVSSAVDCSDYFGKQYVSISMMVCHPVSKQKVDQLELLYNQQPTGIFFDRYPAYDSRTEAYFWAWFYASDYGLTPGEYLVEALATDTDGNASDMFPYFWVK